MPNPPGLVIPFQFVMEKFQKYFDIVTQEEYKKEFGSFAILLNDQIICEN